jgi:hypothetical protein
LFTRCGKLQHRPAHADFQHVDIWWRGINVACDPGTFSYNAPPPWHEGVAATEYHNAVTIDGLSQMERQGRWIWLPWAKGQVVDSHSPKNGWLETAHDGYRRLSDPVEVHRTVLKLPDEHWLVIDRVNGRQTHRCRLHWLLADAAYQQDKDRLVLSTAQGEYQIAWAASGETISDLVRADPDSPRGWRSPYYQHRLPGLSLAVTAEGTELVFATVFGPEVCLLKTDLETVVVDAAGWSVRANLSSDLNAPMLSSVETCEAAAVEA